MTTKIGTIYKLYNTVDDKYYIGGTIQNLANRFSTHKRDARLNKRPNNQLHKLIREIGEDKWKIKTLVVKEFKSKREVCRIEDEYIDCKDPNCLNEKKASGVYVDEYTTREAYHKAKWLNASEHEKSRGNANWEKLKNDPVKFEIYKEKRRERDRRRHVLEKERTGVGQQ